MTDVESLQAALDVDPTDHTACGVLDDGPTQKEG